MTARTSRLRILFVITGLDFGGAERMLLNLVSRMAPAHDISVVSLAERGPMATDFEQAGASVTALNMRGPRSFLPAALRLARHVRSFRPEVVSTWMYHADLIGALAARLAGVRAIAWGIHNGDLAIASTKRSTRMVIRANAWLSGRLPRRILCCSHAARRLHVAQGYRDDLFEVIPNGFDMERFQPSDEAQATVRAELGLAHDAFLVGLVARWHPVKDHSGFLRAATQLAQAHPDVHYLLVGSDCDPANLELARLVSAAGLAGKAHLLGARDDVPRLTAALDIAASSSTGEAFPNVLGEAMACGVPCVATDVGDSAYIVGTAGRIVPPHDPAALATALAELVRMPAPERRALGEQARSRIRQNFELGLVAKRYETAFRAMLGSPRARNTEGSGTCAG